MAKKYDIEIPKMDYQIISIALIKKKIDEEGKEIKEKVQLNENDLMFLTVRENEFSEDYIFQKSLEDGISYNSDTEKYDIEIKSDDTVNMEINKKYGYDITIYYDGNKPKQKSIGNFVIGKKYTLNGVI